MFGCSTVGKTSWSNFKSNLIMAGSFAVSCGRGGFAPETSPLPQKPIRNDLSPLLAVTPITSSGPQVIRPLSLLPRVLLASQSSFMIPPSGLQRPCLSIMQRLTGSFMSPQLNKLNFFKPLVLHREVGGDKDGDLKKKWYHWSTGVFISSLCIIIIQPRESLALFVREPGAPARFTQPSYILLLSCHGSLVKL